MPSNVSVLARSVLPALLLITLPLQAAPLLPEPVAQALQQADLPADALAALVVPLQRNGRARLAHQAERPMQPGSTMKMVTSAVALDRLGPNLRGRTELLSNAAQDGEVLRGDLVLRGGADTELGLPQMAALLAELRYQGIREIAGDVLLDRHLFRPPRIDQGLPPFDEEPEFPYNAIPDALLLGGNLMGMELNSQGARVQARTLPPLAGVEFDTRELVVNDSPCSSWGSRWRTPLVSEAPGQALIKLQGEFPRGCVVRTELQLIDRTALAERQLRALWEGLGGRWAGTVREAAAPADARLLAQRQSRPWGEVLRFMNKTSDNALTRLLYLQLGVAAMAQEPTATTLQLAEREVRRWFDEQRIPTAGLVLDNGSGLSRSERISPRQLASVLQVAHAGRHAPELLTSLPVVGVDGTMRNRMKLGAASGRARLKSGTLRNVVAVAGFVPDDAGRVWVLVAMVNHDRAVQGRAVLDALVEWVAGGFDTSGLKRMQRALDVGP